MSCVHWHLSHAPSAMHGHAHRLLKACHSAVNATGWATVVTQSPLVCAQQAAAEVWLFVEGDGVWKQLGCSQHPLPLQPLDLGFPSQRLGCHGTVPSSRAWP